jgi:hypothetical protein
MTVASPAHVANDSNIPDHRKSISMKKKKPFVVSKCSTDRRLPVQSFAS